jgi:hypothetical protein
MKNSIKVYYASPDNLQETQDWSILYKEPKSLNSYLLDNLNKNRNKDVNNRAYMSCTAFQRMTGNTYVIENPMTSSYTFSDTIESTSKNSLSILIKREPQLNNQILFEYDYPIIFFAEESLEIQYTPPYFLNAPHLQYGAVTPGQFNIGKWFRPIQTEINLWEDINTFSIRKDEPLAFINFLTDKKINFIKFHMSKELAKIMNVCSTGSVWEKNVPLVNRYKRFHESQMIEKTLKLIKSNILWYNK